MQHLGEYVVHIVCINSVMCINQWYASCAGYSLLPVNLVLCGMDLSSRELLDAHILS